MCVFFPHNMKMLNAVYIVCTFHYPCTNRNDLALIRIKHFDETNICRLLLVSHFFSQGQCWRVCPSFVAVEGSTFEHCCIWLHKATVALVRKDTDVGGDHSSSSQRYWKELHHSRVYTSTVPQPSAGGLHTLHVLDMAMGSCGVASECPILPALLFCFVCAQYWTVFLKGIVDHQFPQYYLNNANP